MKVSGLEQLGEEALDANRDQPVNRFFGTRSKFFAYDPFGHQNFSETILNVAWYFLVLLLDIVNHDISKQHDS